MGLRLRVKGFWGSRSDLWSRVKGFPGFVFLALDLSMKSFVGLGLRH